MPERSTKGQRVQLGWETTYGTAAVATKRLLSLGITPDAQATRRRNFAQGYNFPSSTSMERDFTEGTLEGAAMFDEIVVPLQMLLGATTPTALTPATAFEWVWDIPLFGDVNPRSATIEKGDANTGERFSGAVATGFNMTWNRNEITVSAPVMGGILDLAATMATSGVTAYPQVPMNPNGIGMFLDPTYAGLGTTRMLRAFEGGISLGDFFGQVWPLNDLKPSFDGIVGLQPSADSTVTLAADTAGKALLTDLRAGDRRYLRWAIKGPQIGAGPAAYLFQIDQAIEVVDVDAFSDSDGIYAIPLTFSPVADEVNNIAVKITVVNTMDGTTG
jgi:hypothetical protein